MSTKYIASNWRLLNQENSNKSDNYGLIFDGSSEKINCGDSNVLSFGDGSNDSPFSISLWFNLSTLATPSCLLCKQTSSSNGEYKIYISTAGKIYIELANNGGEANGARGIISNSTISINQWYNIIFTYDGTGGSSAYDGMNLYINNTLDSSTDWSYLSYTAMNNTTADFIIGDLITGSSNTYDFTGEMSELAIYDYTLSESQISTLYGSSSLGAGNPMALPTPVAYYPLGDNSASNPLTQPNEAVEDASVFDFDGAIGGALINLGNDSSLNITGSLSVSAWFKTLNNSDTIMIATKDNGGASRAWQLYMHSTGAIKFGINGVTAIATSSGVYDDGNWHHVLGVYEPSNYVKLYIDGSEDGEDTTSVPASINSLPSQDVVIGGYDGYDAAGGRRWDGQLSNIAIFNSNQSSEILNIYNSGVPATSYTNTPTAWYKLDQSANWEADTSGAWQIPDAVSAYPQSFNFDAGSSEDINCGNNSIFDITENITLSGWINRDDNLNLSTIITKWNSGPTDTAYILRVGSSGGAASNSQIQMLIRNTSGVAVIATEVVGEVCINKWVHIMGTYNGSTIRLFYNGVELGSGTAQTGNIQTSTAPLRIGSRGAEYIDGKMSNIAIWNSDQSSEISNIYNSGIPAVSYTNTPTAWYKLDNTATWTGSAYSVPDASGNGNTGTSSGMTEQNLVNNNVSALNGESSGMTSANLVLSDLTRAVPYGDGYSFNFDAPSNDYIDCGTGLGNSLTTVTNLTVSTWIKADITNGNDLFFYIGSFTGQWGKINFQLNGNNLYIRINGNGYIIQKSYSSNDWNNISFVYDGSDVNNTLLYINGQEQTPDSSSGIYPSSIDLNGLKTIIGAGYALGYTLDGKMSNVSIFNEALTSTEVQKLYSNGVPQDLANFTPAPVAWYPLGSNSFWNGSQWTVRDMIGSNDGTGQNIGVDGLVGDAPRSSAGGTATNMDVPTNLEGSTKWSDNNSWSINMGSTARVEDTP